MQVSQTYDYEKNDHINRANMALICGKYFGIKDVLPSLYQIAAPVSELAYINKNGERIETRDEIAEAIPWNERSMRSFGVVYSYESTASFIGMDGRTYIVPNDKPVLEYLKECGYVIAPYGKNLDGNSNGDDSLIFEEKSEDVAKKTQENLRKQFTNAENFSNVKVKRSGKKVTLVADVDYSFFFNSKNKSIEEVKKYFEDVLDMKCYE